MAAAAAGVVALLAVALSISSVREMFEIRAEVLQSYDTGERTSRFSRQLDAVGVLLEEPNGLGPMQFGQRFGQDVHNVYLNAFIAYGWVGGSAYLLIVILTLARGLAAIRRQSPWRTYLIAAYATFVGLTLEGLIVDTDHWRHFFLLVGLIWGVSAATADQQRPWRENAIGRRGVSVAAVGPCQMAAPPVIERAGRRPA
jgi:hypothetical protein